MVSRFDPRRLGRLRNDLAALRVFADLVYALPREGEPRIGYALAAAGLRLDPAAYGALRQALRDEPTALDVLPDDPEFRAVLVPLLERYGAT